MKYPYGTISCIIGAVLNALFTGMDIVNESGVAMVFNASLSAVCLVLAIHSSIQCWSLKEKLFKAYIGSRNA